MAGTGSFGVYVVVKYLMNIGNNKLMKETLLQRAYDFIKEMIILPVELDKLLNSGFIDETDCVLLKELEYFRYDIDSDF